MRPIITGTICGGTIGNLAWYLFHIHTVWCLVIAAVSAGVICKVMLIQERKRRP